MAQGEQFGHFLSHFRCLNLNSNGIRQDDEPYLGRIYSTDNVSTLPLEGIKSEIGAYACRWNNSLGQVGFRNVTLFLSDETSSEMETYYTTIIVFAVTLAILLALGIGISVKLYFDLVSVKNESK